MTPAQAEALFDALILDHPEVMRLMAVAEPRVTSVVQDRLDSNGSPFSRRNACEKFGVILLQMHDALDPHSAQFRQQYYDGFVKFRDTLRRIVTEGRGALDYQEADKLVAIAEEALK